MTDAPILTQAVGRSISFRPASLYDDAVNYGKANAAKPDGVELNPSEVVCLALRRLFETEGFVPGRTDEVSVRLEKVKRARATTAKKIDRLLLEDERHRLAS